MSVLFYLTSQLKKLQTHLRKLSVFVFAIIFLLSLIPTALLSTVSAQAEEYYIQDYDVNIRNGPGTEYDPIGSLSSGSQIEPLSIEYDREGNEWYSFSYKGQLAYVFADCVEKLSNDVTLQNELETSADADDLPEAWLPEDSSESDAAQENDVESGPTEETSDEHDFSEEPSESETSESEEIEEQEETTEAENETDDDDYELYATASQPSWSGYIQSEAEFNAQLKQFPESYQAGLRAIHEVYPNYTFTADYIDMDFEELVDYQIGKKVSAYYANSYKAMYDDSFGYYENYNWDTGEWYNSEGMFTYASREVIEYYIDPRNFLDTSNIYMFVRESYSSDQTVDDLRSILEGSFLADGYVPNKNDPDDVRLNGDYAAVIMEAAQISGISPFAIAASIIIEHGYSGDTPLISGYYEANDGTVYRKLYNFFDIGATGTDSDNVIQNGLEYAKAQGWTSRYKSIVNGSVWNADGYISNGQDTYYYREFNVINGWDSLWHQYSTAIMSAYCSASMMRSALSSNQYAALNFRIPVYNNMPATPASEPEYNDNLNNYYFTDMEASGLEPEFSMANRDYSMTVTQDTLLKVSVPKWASYEGRGFYSLKAGQNTVTLDVRSQTGYLRTYTIQIKASQSCTLKIEAYEGNHLIITDDSEDSSAGISSGWGDANGDGRVSVLDYIAIKNHIMGTKTITNSVNLSAADANGDGKVSVLDYIAIKNYIMSK